MNRKVYLVTELDEVYIGTVSELIDGVSDGSSGIGIPVASMISDLIADLAFDPEGGDKVALTIELR
jgi:hypothetical protein